MDNRLLSVSMCIPESSESEGHGIESDNDYGTNKLEEFSQQSTNKLDLQLINSGEHSYMDGTYRTKRRNYKTESSSDSDDDNSTRSKKRICKGKYSRESESNLDACRLNSKTKKRTYEDEYSSNSEDEYNVSSSPTNKAKKRVCRENKLLFDSMARIHIGDNEDRNDIAGCHKNRQDVNRLYRRESKYDYF
ncbi:MULTISPECIES: hypothetical protein [Candidatus Ichthyocystis]|uniref:Uncharacterized protein n=1 Tax=Candidatus Ichthyocystis hellenicum TaxID=1561003 RepID=A0A0S4M2R7_9BURK|nr:MULTISPECIES: hypothetical protein [Ichthyocystis]CUT17921.1 hypothetical protein Ark11_1108 [Candidatus Ichthyocystis hellenicum]